MNLHKTHRPKSIIIQLHSSINITLWCTMMCHKKKTEVWDIHADFHRKNPLNLAWKTREGYNCNRYKTNDLIKYFQHCLVIENGTWKAWVNSFQLYSYQTVCVLRQWGETRASTLPRWAPPAVYFCLHVVQHVGERVFNDGAPTHVTHLMIHDRIMSMKTMKGAITYNSSKRCRSLHFM